MKILVSDPLHPDGIKMLRDAGFEVIEQPDISYDELKEKIKDFEVLIVRSRTKVTREIIESAEKLTLIARAGVGLDNIDVKTAQEKNIAVINAPEAPTYSVAELVIGLMIAALRGIPRGDMALKEGKWIKKKLLGRELNGKTLGIVGFGRIGQEVAKRALAFNMKVLTYDVIGELAKKAEELGVEFVGTTKEALYKLLKESDIITLHVPLLPSTYHMIGREEISLMKNGAVIINTSRGGIIDEKALYEALKEGKIAAAALDVFENEPPTDVSLKLAQLPNVVATPHIGASTEEAQRKAATIIAQKIIDYFSSKQ
ncbi:MAG: D-2-hydroxyacid dehydrogenase [Candidatus Odinarchaeota archaeon]|nr:D-2-hydroxyacid dehydrogenase [Candidatus Odinarchaeota archaeon]